MKAAWYEKQGPAEEVLTIGEMPDPEPGPREMRIRISASGVNPGDVKKRRDDFGYGMSFPRVIPHSDGAGIVDKVGENVSDEWLGQRVWCFGAQSGRAFGTAAEYAVVPADQVLMLPEGVSMEQGACLGIPGITAHRCVRVAGSVSSRTMLVRGGAGAVGLCAVQLAHREGAFVVATVRSESDVAWVRESGADEVLLQDDDLVEKIRTLVPNGVDHIVEVAFGANVSDDVEVLAPGGSIAAYATDGNNPEIPFWPLAFKNVGLFFLGSDDFKLYEKISAARDLNAALVAGWKGFQIASTLPLSEIARAHHLVEQPAGSGRVVVTL